MLQEQQARLKQALQRRKIRLLSEAMTESTPNAWVLTPDIWSNDLSMLTDTPVVSQSQEVACPECRRTFKQAWALKQRMRTYHDTPCETEDLFQPLRDAWQGRPICSHCVRSFVDFYRLRYHINKRAYMAFNVAQDSITSIAGREDLRIYLRYKSIPGLLLNQALMVEFVQHCAYCHSQIASRSIRKHYEDQYAYLDPLTAQYKDHVTGLANLGSGRGRCYFCDRECRDIRAHDCGVLFQLSALLGQIFQPEYFPIMPVMMKPVRVGRTDPQPQHRSIPAPLQAISPIAHLGPNL